MAHTTGLPELTPNALAKRIRDCPRDHRMIREGTDILLDCETGHVISDNNIIYHVLRLSEQGFDFGVESTVQS